MTLHFVCKETMERLNICFDKENYNTNIYPESQYVEVSKDAYNLIYGELDFNCYWYEDDLEKEHESTLEEWKEEVWN